MKNEDRSLELYLNEIRKLPPTKDAEEVQLARRIKRGDVKALEKLIKGNLLFVISVARRYQNLGLSLADLICEGNMGLIGAAKKFDETRGFRGNFIPFRAYASWRIRGAILVALRKHKNIVCLPQGLVGTLRGIRKTSSQLEQNLGREPAPNEIAKELELGEHEVSGTLKISKPHLSLDAPLSTSRDDSDVDTLMDVLEDESLPSLEESLLSYSLRIELEKVFDSLTPHEAEVINLYYGLNSGEPLTLKETGSKLSLTEGYVGEIKKRAIGKLRQALTGRGKMKMVINIQKREE